LNPKSKKTPGSPQPVFEENIFRMPVDVRWAEALRKMGVDPALLSDTAGHA